MLPARLVVLASGEGTTLQAVLDACADPAYGAVVVAVGSDRTAAPALRRGRVAGARTWVVEPGHACDRSDFDARVLAELRADTPDLVVCAGYLRILGPSVVRALRIVNTHPSLLPAFPGAHAVRDALAAGVAETGVTVHVVDEGLDTGPVLAQRRVPVEPTDDEGSLRARIQGVERGLYVDIIGRLAREGWPARLQEARS